MDMAKQLASQMQEALDPVNKWYCSQFYGREITDPETLLCYYIKHGGARNFRQRIQTVQQPQEVGCCR